MEKLKYLKLIHSLPHMQKADELFELCNFLVSNFEIKTIVEIGTMCGGTSAFFKIVFPKAIVMGMDAHILPDFINQQKKHSLLGFQGNSHSKDDANKIMEIMPGDKIDFVFIDADHSYKAAKADYLCWKDKARILAFHDIVVHSNDLDVGVYKVWNEIKTMPNQRFKEFIKSDQADGTSTWAGIGVLYD